MRNACKSPDEATETELHWLAGLLEGEGSFIKGSPSAPHLPSMQCVMVDRDVMDRAAAIIGCRIIPIKARKAHWKESYGFRVRGAPAVAWMRALAPLVGRRRRAQIEAAVASHESRSNQVLDDDAALAALRMLRDGASVRSVAASFGVSHWAIYDLRLGRTHRHVPRPGDMPDHRSRRSALPAA